MSMLSTNIVWSSGPVKMQLNSVGCCRVFCFYSLRGLQYSRIFGNVLELLNLFHLSSDQSARWICVWETWVWSELCPECGNGIVTDSSLKHWIKLNKIVHYDFLLGLTALVFFNAPRVFWLWYIVSQAMCFFRQSTNWPKKSIGL